MALDRAIGRFGADSRSYRNRGKSFDLKSFAAGIARDELLCRAVDEQIEIFEHNRPDKSCLAFWLTDGRESAISSQESDKHALDCTAPGAAAIGITNLDRLAQRQAQPLHNTFWQHQPRCPGIDNTTDHFATNLIRGEMSSFSQRQVSIIRNLDLDAEASHAARSFGLHCAAPCTGARMLVLAV
jgi:hypothetical protein